MRIVGHFIVGFQVSRHGQGHSEQGWALEGTGRVGQDGGGGLAPISGSRGSLGPRLANESTMVPWMQ